MKRVALITAYLTVMTTLVFAQLPNLFAVTSSNTFSKGIDSQEPKRDTQPIDEFVPSNNLPFFPGGLKAMLAYFDRISLYPEQARMSNQQGTVHVRFWVQPSGQLTHIQVIKSKGPLLDSAAVRAVGQMPYWYPAHQSGRPVACPVRLSITFQADDVYSSSSLSAIP